MCSRQSLEVSDYKWDFQTVSRWLHIFQLVTFLDLFLNMGSLSYVVLGKGCTVTQVATRGRQCSQYPSWQWPPGPCLICVGFALEGPSHVHDLPWSLCPFTRGLYLCKERVRNYSLKLSFIPMDKVWQTSYCQESTSQEVFRVTGKRKPSHLYKVITRWKVYSILNSLLEASIGYHESAAFMVQAAIRKWLPESFLTGDTPSVGVCREPY